MRCPKCGQTYDNSWKMCLNCSEKLVDDAAISNEKASELKENVKKTHRPKLLTVMIVLMALSFGSIPKAVMSATATFFGYVLSGAIAVVYNITGVLIMIAIFFGLLFKKNLARLALIFVSSLNIIETLFQAISGKDNILKIAMAGMSPEKAKAVIEKGQQQLLLGISYFFIFAYILIGGLIIYYLTRPKIKEYFKQG